MPGGGTGTNINDTANWAVGVVDGDFSTITEAGPTYLVLTGDMTFTSGAEYYTTLTFAKGSSNITFSSVSGIEPGQHISGVNMPYNTFLIALDGLTGTLSQATWDASSGTYTFVRPAFNFNFGMYGTRASGVSVVIGSSPAGTPRTLTVNRRLILSQTTAVTNSVTFAGDIAFCQDFSGAFSVNSEWGSVSGGAAKPLLRIDGPVAFSAGAGWGLALNGGDCFIGGAVSGSGRSMEAAATFPMAGTLTLTNPGNSFSGGALGSGITSDGVLAADSATVLANAGSNSALGSSGVLGFNANDLVLSGFTAPQVSDRPWDVGGGNANLYNDGGAPLILTGTVTNSYGAGKWLLRGTYRDCARPNIVGGPVEAKNLEIMIRDGVWRLTNSLSAFPGIVSVAYGDQAALQFASVADAGAPSALGAGSLVRLYLASTNPNVSGINYFEYVGEPPASTDRKVALYSLSQSGENAILANGGRLTLAGTVTNETAAAAALSIRTLRLGGTGEGVIAGDVGLGDNITDGLKARVGIVKTGSGTWTAGGSGLNHQGPTEVRSGSLILDYTGGDHIPASAPGDITVQGGRLVFRGKPSGATSDTVGNLLFGSGTVNFRAGTLSLDANGGDGVSLTVGKLDGGNQTQKQVLFDLSSSPGNTLTLSALGSNVSFLSGILGMTASGRALFLVRTAGGYAFASTNSLRQVVPLVPSDPMPTAGGNPAKNYLLSTSASLTGNLAYNTVTVDSGAAPVTLALGPYNLLADPNNNGRAILFRGANDVTVSSTGGKMTANTAYCWNYLGLSATLRYGADLRKESSYQYVTWGGPGFTLYSGLSLGSRFALFSGVFRMTADQALSVPDTPLVLSDGGVLEIGADLNGAEAGDFSLACGTNNGCLALYGDAGLSAAGATRTVNLGGEGAALAWGANGFLTHVNGEDCGYTLKLSSARADATIDFKNPIGLNGNSPHGRRRTVEVADGGATVDARLSGAVSGHSVLVKTGAGTLEVTAAQGYDALAILAGTFRAGAGTFTGGTVPVRLEGGTLAGAGVNSFGALGVSAGSTLDLGDGTAAFAFADSAGMQWEGTLKIAGAWTEGAVRFGTDGSALTGDQLARITVGAAKVALTGDGYLRRILAGTMIGLR